MNNFICQIGNWSIRFSVFSFPFIFLFFFVYNYYRLPHQSIYKHMKRGFLRRTFEYRWKKRKKKWCMYWFPLYRCFGTASWTNALHICRFEFIWGRGLWNFSKGFRCFELNSASLTLYDFITDILLRNVSKSSKSWNFSYLLHIFRICQTRKWIVILNNFSSFMWLLLTVDLRFSFDFFGYSRVFTDLFGSFRMRSLLRWLSELFGSCRILSDPVGYDRWHHSCRNLMDEISFQMWFVSF